MRGQCSPQCRASDPYGKPAEELEFGASPGTFFVTHSLHTWRRREHLSKAVQELLGHANIKMTMSYAHLSPDARRDTTSLLDNHDMVEAIFPGAGVKELHNIKK